MSDGIERTIVSRQRLSEEHGRQANESANLKTPRVPGRDDPIGVQREAIEARHLRRERPPKTAIIMKAALGDELAQKGVLNRNEALIDISNRGSRPSSPDVARP